MQEDKIPHQQGDDLFDLSKVERRVYFLVDLGSGFTLFLRRFGGGCESPGTPGFVAMFALVSWAFASHNLLCLWYAEASIVAMVVYRLTRNNNAYSRYEGRPYLQLIIPNERLASLMEPALLLGVGAWFYERIPAFAVIFLFSGVCCAATEAIAWHQRRRMLIEYRNAKRVMEYQRELYQRAGK